MYKGTGFDAQCTIHVRTLPTHLVSEDNAKQLETQNSHFLHYYNIETSVIEKTLKETKEYCIFTFVYFTFYKQHRAVSGFGLIMLIASLNSELIQIRKGKKSNCKF